MKALFTDAPGGWEHTQIIDMPEPVPAGDEVLVDIQAVGLNPADYFQVQGQYPGQPKAPFVTGRDAAGVIAKGSGTSTLPPGTQVVVIQSQTRNLAEGTLCERQRFKTTDVAPLPNGWSIEEGAAAPLPLMTAWRALKICADCREGSAVLVTGASGGVGIAAIQLALGLGAKVVGLSRSAEKRKRLESLGVAQAFDPEDPDLKKKVPAAIGKHGVDIVVETVGGPFIRTAVHLLAPYGRVGVVGVLAGVEGPLPIPSLMFKRAVVQGILVSDYPKEEALGEWNKIVDVLGRSNSRPIIDKVFPLSDYRGAVEHLQSSPFGKVVIRIPQ